MAEALAISMHDNSGIEELLELLKSPGFQSQRKEYESLLDGVETIVKQYNSILTELDALKEKVGKITDRKNPLAVMVECLENLAASIGEELNSLKESILSFTKNALNTVKEKGLSALGSVFGFLHVKDGLQAMASGLAKSAEALDKAVTRVDSLEQFHRERAAVREAAEKTQPNDEIRPVGEQSVSLADLVADMRLDFENLTPEELKATYEKLLAIGMDNDLTANELNCLQSLTDEAESLLPERGETETAQEAENELDQGEEI
jgi:hypothetical protein